MGTIAALRYLYTANSQETCNRKVNRDKLYNATVTTIGYLGYSYKIAGRQNENKWETEML